MTKNAWFQHIILKMYDNLPCDPFQDVEAKFGTESFYIEIGRNEEDRDLVESIKNLKGVKTRKRLETEGKFIAKQFGLKWPEVYIRKLFKNACFYCGKKNPSYIKWLFFPGPEYVAEVKVCKRHSRTIIK